MLHIRAIHSKSLSNLTLQTFSSYCGLAFPQSNDSSISSTHSFTSKRPYRIMRKRFCGIGHLERIAEERKRISALEDKGRKITHRTQEWKPPARSAPSCFPSGYRLVNLNYIFSTRMSVACVQVLRKGRSVSSRNFESRRGLCSRFRLHCTTCRKDTLIFDSSRNVRGSDRGKSCDVNRRATNAVLLGTGRQAIVRFCAAFDRPPHSLRDSWDANVGHISEALNRVNINIMSTYRHTYVV